MEVEITKDEEEALRDLAEKAVKIPVGGMVGGWTREKRVALVYAAIRSIYRLNKIKELSL